MGKRFRSRALVGLFVLLQMLGSMFVVDPAAAAGVYPPGTTVSVATDKQAYAIGETVTISAIACAAGETVTFTVTLPNGSTVVLTAVAVAVGDQNIATVTMVGSVNGDYSVVATCAGTSAVTAFSVFTLPITGTNVMRPITIGALALLIGSGLFIVGRTRRRPKPRRVDMR